MTAVDLLDGDDGGGRRSSFGRGPVKARRCERCPRISSSRPSRPDCSGLAMPRSLGGLELDPLAIVSTDRGAVPRRRVGRVDGADRQLDGVLRMARSRCRDRRCSPERATSSRRACSPHGTGTPRWRRVRHRWAMAVQQWLHARRVVPGRGDGDGRRSTRCSAPTADPTSGSRSSPATGPTIIDTWHSMGLRGTGSHDIEVTGSAFPSSTPPRRCSIPPRRPARCRNSGSSRCSPC